MTTSRCGCHHCEQDRITAERDEARREQARFFGLMSAEETLRREAERKLALLRAENETLKKGWDEFQRVGVEQERLIARLRYHAEELLRTMKPSEYAWMPDQVAALRDFRAEFPEADRG